MRQGGQALHRAMAQSLVIGTDDGLQQRCRLIVAHVQQQTERCLALSGGQRLVR